MKAKFFYNVILNLGIVLMTYSAVRSFQVDNYPIFGICLVVVLVLVYLKFKLLQQVKSNIPKK